MINLILFFGFEHGEKMKDEAEYVSKVSNTVINLIGICALIIGNFGVFFGVFFQT